MFRKINMLNNFKLLFLVSLLVLSFSGCSNNSEERESNATVSETETNDSETKADSNNDSNSESTDDSNVELSGDTVSEVPDLEVRFGYGSDSFILHLYDNDTAAEIAKEVGSADWNLPIYHYDDFENYEVMQYYDIPDRYTFSSNPETVTSEKAGEVYYSDPNRIILFYQDAEVTGEYTKLGYIDYTDDLYDAVVNNPVVEGWGNKIVSIVSSK